MCHSAMGLFCTTESVHLGQCGHPGTVAIVWGLIETPNAREDI